MLSVACGDALPSEPIGEFTDEIGSNCSLDATVRVLPKPPGTLRAGVGAVNDKREMVGGVVFDDPVEPFSVPAVWDKHERVTILPRLGQHSGFHLMNEHGEAAGQFRAEDGSRSGGFGWSRRRGFVEFEVLASPNAGNTDLPRGMNDRNEVVGTAEIDPDTPRSAQLAVLWNGDNGAVEERLGTLGGSVAEAFDINNAGVVVGLSALANQRAAAFRWTRDEGMSQLMLPPDVIDSYAVAINERGEILVQIFREIHPWGFGILRLDGSFDELPFPDGYVEINAAALNDRGWVVGNARIENGPSHPFIWDQNLQPTALPLPEGAFDVLVWDVNNRTTAVGGGNEVGSGVVWTIRCGHH